jgi:hypothetical protein
MSSVEQKVVGKQLSNSFQQLHLSWLSTLVFEISLAVAVNIELNNYMKEV